MVLDSRRAIASRTDMCDITPTTPLWPHGNLERYGPPAAVYRRMRRRRMRLPRQCLPGADFSFDRTIAIDPEVVSCGGRTNVQLDCLSRGVREFVGVHPGGQLLRIRPRSLVKVLHDCVGPQASHCGLAFHSFPRWPLFAPTVAPIIRVESCKRFTLSAGCYTNADNSCCTAC